MFCRKCGKQILDDSVFCQYCGVRVEEVEEIFVDEVLILTEEEVKSGVTKQISFKGTDKIINYNIPKNTVNGQLFRFKRIKIITDEGKKLKKDFYVKIEIRS